MDDDSSSTSSTADPESAIAAVQAYFASDDWLEGSTGSSALCLVDDAEFEIERLLEDEAGQEGSAFRDSTEYANGKAKLEDLKRYHQAIANQAPTFAAQAPPTSAHPATSDGVADNPLGPHCVLLDCISDNALANSYNFKVILGCLQGEAGQHEDEAPWKAAGLVLYNRHVAASPGVQIQTFEDMWHEVSFDRRLDARAITQFARQSNEESFLVACRASCISDDALANTRNFKVILGGLRGEAGKHEDEAPWKAAGLVLYNRHVAASPGVHFQTFEDMWQASFDRRLDARAITHFARQSNEESFLGVCRRESLPGDLSKRTDFSESELRDYVLLAFGDNLVRIRGVEGTAVWWMRKWNWDVKGRTLEFMTIRAVQNLYIGLLTERRKRRDEKDLPESVVNLEQMDEIITATAKALAKYGNQRNKNIVSLILAQLDAYSLDVDPFDEERHLFAFTNVMFDLRKREFTPHFKFDFMLTNSGREWRKPSAAQRDKVAALFESIIPDTDERKGLVSVLRNGLSGFREELFIILTGGGRNGKGLIIELFQWLCGRYSKAAHLELLTKSIKSGPNTELRSLHKTRSAVWTEPEEGAMEALRLANIKALSGDENHDARGLYNSDDLTRIFATLLLQCNELPHILGDKGVSVRERLVVINFPMTFTDNQQLLTTHPATNRLIDKTLKLPAFKDDHYCALFDYLVTSFPIYGDETGVAVHATEESKRRAGKYLDTHDFFPSWVSEHYDMLAPDPNSDEPVAFASIKELYADFRASPQFQDMTKRERRLMAEGKFRDAIAKSNSFKALYREAQNVAIDGKKTSKDGVINVRKKRDDDEAGPSDTVGSKRGRDDA